MPETNVAKILVVDDEVELRNALVEALSAQSFEVRGFTNGAHALAALREEVFDVLVSDLMMPEMDGITLIEKALEIDPHLVPIIMTGQGTIQTAVGAMKMGAFDYVLKPFRLATMLPTLTRAINARRLRLENMQLRETVAIYELCQTIAFTLDKQTLISKLADAALQQTEADEVSILLPTKQNDELYVAAVRGENRQRLLGERVPLEESISGWVVRQREPLLLTGEVNDARFHTLWPHPEIKSALSIPMQAGNKLIGTININALNRTRPFTLGQMKALTILASAAAAALEGASLYAEVQKAEENYRSIFENAVDGIFRATPDAIKFVSVNPFMAQMFGYESPAEMVQLVEDVTKQLGLDPARRDEALDLLGKHGVVENFETHVRRKDGSEIWVSSNIRAIRDAEGKFAYLDGIVQDITERKRAEAELRFQKTLLESQSEASIDGILVTSADRKILSFNQRFVDLWGIPDTALNSRSDQIALQSVINEMETPEEFLKGVEYLYDHPQENSRDEIQLNDERTFDRYTAPIKSADDEYFGRVWFFRDITERRRSEEALRESEERYRDLVENAHDIIYSHDLEGNYMSVNRAAEQITGYTHNECLALNIVDTVTPEYAGAIRQMIDRKLNGDSVTAYEMEILAKDGRRIAMEVNTKLMYQDGRAVGVQGIARDITERKLAHAELNRLAAAVQQTADSIIITDTAGNIEYVNPAFERITGYTKEEALGQNPRLLKSHLTPPDVYRDLWDTIARGDVWIGQLTNRKKDGSLFTERATISAVRDEHGNIAHYLAVKQDTTHELQLEEQLRQSQKMEAIGQLAGGVAHDFNNLLTAISGYTSLALQRLDEHNSVRPYLEEVKKAGDRAANLTRQLLAFGRKQILQPIPLDLNGTVSDMNKMLRRLIGEDINLSAKLATDLKPIKADPGQIEQVLMNLVVNARDAMPQGGRLTIETANVELDREYTRGHVGIQPGNYVMLAVSDTGTGMSEATRARIFEPFFTTKEKGKGTGLGLSTVYGIVQQSGGSIWVYSEPNQGTSFKVYLPRLEAPVKADEEKPASEIVPCGSETVLLVEDEEVVRGLATHILEDAGYKVLAASGGAEAIQFCTQPAEQIDLLLTDVVMPETSGKEVADRVTALMPHLKVLFMSGYTDEAIVHHGVLDSNVKFIQKPFTPLGLSKKVREVLDSNGHTDRD